jgi:hypothetical protein
MANATLVTQAPKMEPHVFAVDSRDFRREFDRGSFYFQHNLGNHPLFELPRLLQLALETSCTRPNDLYYDAGNIQVGQRWDQTGKGGFSIAEAMERIENCGAWVILHKAHLDPEYGQLLAQCMGELQELIGVNLDRVMRVQEIILFIASPRRVTAYHIDRECNFLLQMRGSKTLYVFDQNDRVVLSEDELEKFWTVDNNAAKYKPEHQHRARAYRLTPGSVVHIPVNAPHWVQNDDNVSVSMSVNFQYRDYLRGNVYRMNYALRRLGLHPTPPGTSPTLDQFKSFSMMPMVWAKRLINRFTE